MPAACPVVHRQNVTIMLRSSQVFLTFRLEKRLEDLGYRSMFSVELEWLLFQETEQSAFEKGYRFKPALSLIVGSGNDDVPPGPRTSMDVLSSEVYADVSHVVGQ